MDATPSAPDSLALQASHFWREWLGNSLHFPIINILLEILVSDPLYYLISPNLVGLLLASGLQAWALSRWERMENPRRLLGNLIGPATFTAIGLSLQGTEFLAAPNHVAYWVFGLLFGIIQSLQPTKNERLHDFFILSEALLRGTMVAAMYYILRARLDPIATMRVPEFLLEPGHLFIVLAVLLLGLNAGLFHLALRQTNNQAQETTRRLRVYATWLFGRDSQGQVISNPNTQTVKREERIILAMNVRGLPRWSEARQPEETVSLLNRYYQTAEATLNHHHALKFKLRAGEVLALFDRVDDGLEAALKLRLQINALLHRQGLGAGIGLHAGPVVEGWLGGKDVKVMDMIGDAVEVARKIEANAGPGELLVSEKMRMAIGTTFRAGPKRLLPIEGRDEPVVVYPLE